MLGSEAQPPQGVGDSRQGHGASCVRWLMAACEIIPSFLPSSSPGEREGTGGVWVEERLAFGAVGTVLALCATRVPQNSHGSMMLACSAACCWPGHGGVDGGRSLCWLRTSLLRVMEPAGPRDVAGSACTPWYLLLHCCLSHGRFKPQNNSFYEGTDVIPAEMSDMGCSDKLLNAENQVA